MTRTAPPGEVSTIEVTLTDLTDGRPRGDASTDDLGGRPPTNWRRLVGLASIAGALTGVIVGVVILAADDAGDDGDSGDSGAVTPETSPGTAPTSEITTPPTLPPLAALPPPDFLTPDTPSAAPQPTSSQTWSLFDRPPVRPSFPVISGVPDGTEDQYALDAAMAELGVDIGRRSTTRLEMGAERSVLDIRITYDEPNDRYEMVALSNGVIERIVVDIDAGWTYVDDSVNTWARLPNDALAESLDVPDMRTFIERFMFGPVRPDTLAAALDVAPGPFVDLGGGLVAREHTVTLVAGSVPEWAGYRLGPIGDVPSIEFDLEIAYTVYVTGEGKIRRVVAAWPRGGKDQLVVHDLIRLTNPVTVELPPPSSVRDLDLPAVDPMDL